MTGRRRFLQMAAAAPVRAPTIGFQTTPISTATCRPIPATNKLLFGSDCRCRDGKGTGGSPLLPQLKGKCVARATLEAAQKLATPDVFRKEADGIMR
jgi:hypothetical protein